MQKHIGGSQMHAVQALYRDCDIKGKKKVENIFKARTFFGVS